MAKLAGVRTINITPYDRTEIHETVIPIPTQDLIPVPVAGNSKTPISVSVSGGSEREFVEWHPMGEYYPQQQPLRVDRVNTFESSGK
jgi:hypothetical protein